MQLDVQKWSGKKIRSHWDTCSSIEVMNKDPTEPDSEFQKSRAAPRSVRNGVRQAELLEAAPVRKLLVSKTLLLYT